MRANKKKRSLPYIKGKDHPKVLGLVKSSSLFFRECLRRVMKNGWDITIEYHEEEYRPIGWLKMYGPYYQYQMMLSRENRVYVLDLKVLVKVWPDAHNMANLNHLLSDKSISKLYACLNGCNMGEPDHTLAYAHRTVIDLQKCNPVYKTPCA